MVMKNATVNPNRNSSKAAEVLQGDRPRSGENDVAGDEGTDHRGVEDHQEGVKVMSRDPQVAHEKSTEGARHRKRDGAEPNLKERPGRFGEVNAAPGDDFHPR